MKLYLLILSLACSLHAAQVNFRWDANTEPNLAGYHLYHGPASGFYTNRIQLGRVTNYSMQIGSKQYFALSAFNTNNQESPLSLPILYDPPATPTNFNFSAVQLITEESCDFVLWEPISTNSTGAFMFPLAFYRLRTQYTPGPR